MILKALYDYYNRSSNLPAFGMEEKEIGFIIVLTKEGEFTRIEDCHIDKHSTKTFLVKKHQERSGKLSWKVADHLYEKVEYILGHGKDGDKKFSTFSENVHALYKKFPYCKELEALCLFYDKGIMGIAEAMGDEAWTSLANATDFISFRIGDDKHIIAEKQELFPIDNSENNVSTTAVCLVTGDACNPVRLSSSKLKS